MNEKINADGLITKVSFSLPFCLYLKDDNYEVRMPTYKAMVKTKVGKHEHIDSRLFIEETDLELRCDRHGRIHYTNVELSIPGQTVIEREIRKQVASGHLSAGEQVTVQVGLEDLVENYSQPALEESIDVINHFVEVYRELTSSFYIRTISRNEVHQATVNWFDKGELLGGTLHVSYGKEGMTLMPEISPPVDEMFRKRLLVYSATSLIAELKMNARDYLDLGNYRMAVIESRTCIEILVDQLLLDDFAHKGKTIEDAKKLLEVSKRAACAMLEDVLEIASINVKLKKGLKEVIGKSLAEDNALWGKWLKAKNNREKAVHKAVDVLEADAKDAIDTLSQIFDFIIESK